MIINGRNLIRGFLDNYPDAEASMRTWFALVEPAKWNTPHDVKNTVTKASILKGNEVIFDIKGGDYRMETSISYAAGVLKVNWVGTHEEYDERNKTR